MTIEVYGDGLPLISSQHYIQLCALIYIASPWPWYSSRADGLCSQRGAPASLELPLLRRPPHYQGGLLHRTRHHEELPPKSGISLPVKSWYEDDQYITIFNPTSEVKYLDGLALCTTALDPSDERTFAGKEDFRRKYIGVETISYFPGSGKEHPIQQGRRSLSPNTPSTTPRNTSSASISRPMSMAKSAKTPSATRAWTPSSI